MEYGEISGLKPTRRRWVAHCTALLAAAAASAWPLRSNAASGRGAQTILIVGDSLSAEYGLQRGAGWVALLERRIAEKAGAAGRAQVVNASISGDTTAGGRSRLPALLKLHRPDIVVIELGGNDALRGLPIDSTRANMVEMAHAAKASGAKVLILGMQLPPNYGRQYGDRFAAMFSDVAKSEGAALVPFLLKGVADVPNAEALFQADRIHPLATAHPTMLDNVWPVLAPLLG